MYKNIKNAMGKRHLGFGIFFLMVASSGVIQCVSRLMVDFKLIELALTDLLIWTLPYLLLGIWQMHKYINIRKSNIAKKLKKYYPERDLDEMLNSLEAELETPIFEKKQVTITNKFVVGHIGMTRKEIVIPVEKIAGVYTWHYLRTGRGAANNFQVILLDIKFNVIVLQLKNENQMVDTAVQIRYLCPNAEGRTYEDYEKFLALPKSERNSRLERASYRNKPANV